MATQRYISTSFWSDRWIRSLNPSDRYLYLYLMTNPLTTIAGIYQITIDRIAFDTGYDERTLRPMLESFEAAGKAVFYDNEWMILPSWPKHQQWQTRSKIKTGIDNVLSSLPKNVLKKAYNVHYSYDLIPYQYESNYSDSDLDLDSDLTSKREPAEKAPTQAVTKTATPEPAMQTRELSPMSDQLADYWQRIITEIQPHETWSNYAKERAALSTLAKRTKALRAKTPMDSDPDMAELLLVTFGRLKRASRSDYWARAPVTPSAVLARLPELSAEISRQYAKQQQAASFDAAEVVF
jgi:hypothetical protein